MNGEFKNAKGEVSIFAPFLDMKPTDPKVLDALERASKNPVAPANPKQAYGDAKLQLQLVPPAASAYIARGLAEGAKKYSPWNWRSSKVEAMTYIAGALRHIAAWVEGEDLDPDSKEGKPHLAGAMASLSILVDAIEGGFVIDNRPPSNAGMLRMLTKGAVVNADENAKSD